MSTNPFPDPCCLGPNPESIPRRQFLKNTLSGLAVAAVGSRALLEGSSLQAAPTLAGKSETLVKGFYNSLTEEQRKAILFSFDDPLRSKVDNNWHITKQKLGEFFTADQQAMVKEIFLKLHSEEYARRVYDQVVHDSGQAGFGDCSVALFGQPDTGKFEFVLTGRHCTRRCDGDSVAGVAFGGPIFYGHAAGSFNEKPDHPGNAYWYQAKRANEVFQMLNGKQRGMALLGQGREEQSTETVKLTGQTTGLPGIPMTELTSDQKDHVRRVIKDVLAPFRKEDAEEAFKWVEKNGFDHLHMAFYKNQDVGKDGVWDVWQVEGPTSLMYFRGDPHVHAWIHIKETV